MISSLVCAVAFGLLRSDLVTLDTGCERLPVLLKQLSARSKNELHCSAAFENEVLFVSVKDEPLPKLLEQIAAVCHADWEVVRGEQWLRRNGKSEAADRKADEQMMLEVLRTRLRDVIASPPKTLSAAEEERHFVEYQQVVARVQEASLYSPERQKLWDQLHTMTLGGRGLNRILAAMDLSVLARQLPWQYKLYATSPNRLQVGLGAAAARSLGAFAQEESFVIERLLAMTPEEQLQARKRFGHYGSYMMPIAGPVSAYIRGHWLGTDAMFLEAEFLDRDGYCLELEGRIIDAWPDADLKGITGLEGWGGANLELSPELRAAAACVYSSGQRPVRLEGADMPLAHDPLGLLFDSPLAQLAQASGKGVVAAIPDEAAEPFTKKLGEGMNLRGLCENLGRYLSFRDDAGTLVLTPRKRWQAFAARAKRKPLQDLVSSKKPVNLDEACKYVLAQNDCAGATGIENVVFSLNQCNWVSFQTMGALGNPAHGSRSKLKLYALLSDQQRAQLMASGLRYADLSPPQRSAVDSWTYEANPHLMVQESQEDKRRQLQMLNREPSVTLLDGISPNMLLKGSLTKEPSLLLSAPNGRVLMESCRVLGYLLAEQEGKSDANSEFPGIAESKLTPGYQTVLEVEITYLPNVTDGFQIRDHRCEDVAASTWQSLPAAWLKAFSDALQESRRKVRQPQAPPAKVPPP